MVGMVNANKLSRLIEDDLQVKECYCFCITQAGNKVFCNAVRVLLVTTAVVKIATIDISLYENMRHFTEGMEMSIKCINIIFDYCYGVSLC